MGKVMSMVLRPIKSFNIENRAHRIISKDKPDPAPKYPSNFQEIQRALEVEPDLVEKLSNKNLDLDTRLRDVFVTSEGSNEDVFLKQRHNPKRPLPHDRDVVPYFDYGLKESEVIPYGKTSLRHVLQFLTDYQVNPKEFSTDKIAIDYKMKKEDVDNIVKYFKTFDIYIQGNKNVPSQLVGPTQMRSQLESMNNQIEPGENTEKNEKSNDSKNTS